jgi:hypothetical protein
MSVAEAIFLCPDARDLRILGVQGKLLAEREDDYSASLGTGALSSNRPIARQCGGRRCVFSSINAGAARLLVRFGPVAFFMGHKQRVSA